MRIAQVAPLAEAVPPLLYGGTERVVSYLTEALVALGHEVTLFATAESETEATLVSAPRTLRLAPGAHDPIAPHVCLVQTVLRRAAAFDVVHFHIDHVHLPAFAAAGVPYLTTLHGRLDLPELPALFRAFPDAPLVSISDAQRRPLPDANFIGTVHHGLPAGLLRPSARHEGYLACLDRVCRPEKGVDKAIRIAAAAGMPLRIAAKVDKADEAYFAEVVRPMLGAPGGAEFVGEIGQAEMDAFLGGAAALLCPIDWPEPFGLVLIEAMACGTPVVAFDRGSVPEVVEDGVAGFVVRDEAEAVAAVGRLPSLERRRVREAFDRRFTSARMAADYVRLYERLVQADRATPVREAADRFASAAPIRTNSVPERNVAGLTSTSAARLTSNASKGISSDGRFQEQDQADLAPGAAGKAMSDRGGTRGRASP